mgnify:FL=1
MNHLHDITRKALEELLSENGPLPAQDQIHQTEDALIDFASAHAVPAPAHLKQKMLAQIRLLNEKGKTAGRKDTAGFPMLDATSNWLEWQKKVEGIKPPEDFDNIHLHTLESSETRELFVIWVKEYVPEEVHHDLLESFLLLEGSCECLISDEQGNTRTVQLHAGDYIEMAIGETHDIRITVPPYTKAILQWRKVA